jgi:hypothetical protein
MTNCDAPTACRRCRSWRASSAEHVSAVLAAVPRAATSSRISSNSEAVSHTAPSTSSPSSSSSLAAAAAAAASSRRALVLSRGVPSSPPLLSRSPCPCACPCPPCLISSRPLPLSPCPLLAALAGCCCPFASASSAVAVGARAVGACAAMVPCLLQSAVCAVDRLLRRLPGAVAGLAGRRVLEAGSAGSLAQTLAGRRHA